MTYFTLADEFASEAAPRAAMSMGLGTGRLVGGVRGAGPESGRAWRVARSDRHQEAGFPVVADVGRSPGQERVMKARSTVSIQCVNLIMFPTLHDTWRRSTTLLGL